MSKREPTWQPLNTVLLADLPSKWSDWLSYSGSMTERLQDYCQKVAILVLSQLWQHPFESERKILGVPENELAFIREVKIVCDEEPWLFARSVIPLATLTATEGKLSNLGTIPIGNVLFADETMRRGIFEIAQTKPEDYFFHAAGGGELSHKFLWARRSVFYIRKQPLLVNEVFTPGAVDNSTMLAVNR